MASRKFELRPAARRSRDACARQLAGNALSQELAIEPTYVPTYISTSPPSNIRDDIYVSFYLEDVYVPTYVRIFSANPKFIVPGL